MDAGGKRCLPTWMLKKGAPEELQESGNGESHVPFQGQAQIQASLQQMKATVIEGGEEFPRQEAKKLDRNPGSLSRSETRKRSRQCGRLGANPNTTSRCNSNLERKKAPARKAAHNRSAMWDRSSCEKLKQTINESWLENDVDLENPNTTSRCKSSLERKKAPVKKSAHNRSATWERSGREKLKQTINESWPENDVDLESLFLTRSEHNVGLTVGDLVSIAEEYVNADKEKQYLQKANEESKSEAHNPNSSFFSKNNFGALCGAAQSGPRISKCTTTTYSSDLSAADKVESIPLSISRTGGVAQDMLDVFLGPLLRIPTEERKHERTPKEDVTTACELSGLHRNNTARDKELPLTKKKSSLKDKVAIFLTDSGRTNAP